MKKALTIVLLIFIILSSIQGCARDIGVTAIEASNGNFFILTNTSTVWGWGENQYSLLGNSSVTCLRSPWLVQSNVTYVKQVSPSGSATVVVKDDGTVWSWGLLTYGQMGNGERAERALSGLAPNTSIPIKANIDNVKKAAAGSGFTIALKDDGTVWEWGSGSFFTDFDLLNKQNYSDPLAHLKFVLSPVQVEGLSNIIDVEAGQDHAVALDKDGRVWMWGVNITNDSEAPGLITTPVQVSISNVKAVTAGYSFSLALKDDGTVWGWGDDSFGELGDGGAFSWFTSHTIIRSTPVQVQGLTDVIAIHASRSTCFALKRDGTVWTWGRMDSDDVRTTPVQVPIDHVVAIASGTGFGVALKDDGTVWVWGDQLLRFGDGYLSSTPAKVPLDNIQTANTLTTDYPSNVGGFNPGINFDGLVNPITVTALVAIAVIICGVAYYIKKNW